MDGLLNTHTLKWNKWTASVQTEKWYIKTWFCDKNTLMIDINRTHKIFSYVSRDGNSAVSSKPPLPVAERITPSPRALRAPNNKTPLDRRTPSPLTECPSVFYPEVRFLVNTQSYAGRFQTLFFYIAHKKLRRSEWKSLAKHWNFTEEQVEAIELQHKG